MAVFIVNSVMCGGRVKRCGVFPTLTKFTSSSLVISVTPFSTLIMLRTLYVSLATIPPVLVQFWDNLLKVPPPTWTKINPLTSKLRLTASGMQLMTWKTSVSLTQFTQAAMVRKTVPPLPVKRSFRLWTPHFRDRMQAHRMTQQRLFQCMISG